MVGFTKRKVETLTLGEKLRKIREKAGISLAEIASNTKVKQEYLEKIESGDYENLPFDVYIKGFLRSYANYLDLDPEKVISQFNKEVGVRENVKKYQNRGERKWFSAIPSLTITPKMASLFFSIVIVLIGFGYFYMEVDHFSKDPNLVIDSPVINGTVNASSIEISGQTDFENKIVINNEPVYVDAEGRFKENVGLQKGANEIVVEAFNKFDKNTRKVINVIAEYELETFVAGVREEQTVETGENEAVDESFYIEIESRETSSWISYQSDENQKQSNTLHPGTVLRMNVEKQIEVSSGKASDTYVRINDGEFFPIDENTKGFKKIVLNREGIISENQKESSENEDVEEENNQ